MRGHSVQGHKVCPVYTENTKEVLVTGALLVTVSVVRGEGKEVGEESVSSLTFLSGMEILWSGVKLGSVLEKTAFGCCVVIH